MKKSKSVIQFGLSAVLALGLLGSCSEETETLAPQPVEPIEEAVITLSDAVPIDVPESEEVVEDISNLPFPLRSSLNARVATEGVTDYVDFNDPNSLDELQNDAVDMVARWPFYVQKVGSAWIHVKEHPLKMGSGKGYGHYHLGYQYFNAVYNVYTGEWCKPVLYGCIEFDPIQEHRYLTTHSLDQRIKIYAYDYNSTDRVFDLKGIFVRSGPIKIRFRKQNGQWYQFSSVEPGVYNFSDISSGITQVLISSVSGAPVSFDNIKVHVPAI
ncbi:MAG: hypothetical protein RIG62_28085 [Cyclobacteriaceae bacterium]